MVVLADGTQLRLRPIGHGDRDALEQLFHRLSPESRYRRFLTSKPRLSEKELEDFTAIDHLSHDAVAAIDVGDRSIVGVGRYARDKARRGTAHIAITVVDEHQGKGLGTALARRTVERARANGFRVLVATTLWENRPAHALLRRFGFRVRGTEGGAVEHELELRP
jgi:RimJ/RimL family protein N-acetyltransferase